jgi:hypothetical protein
MSTTPETPPAPPPALKPPVALQPPLAGRPPVREDPFPRQLRAVGGWLWRLIVGARMCFSGYLLSFLTSVVAFGWTYRWMQAVVLRGWWKQSRFRNQGTFEDFCETLGRDAPVARPRWFFQERFVAAVTAPAPGGGPPSLLRKVLRCLKVPWASLWLNFKLGVRGLFCTYLLTGMGCLVMLFSWEYGWLNSFNKGYEEAFFGLLTGVLGSLMLIAALFYVPMAQAHQAATGVTWTFFDFRFVWRLIQARLTAYVALAFLVTLFTLVLEGIRVATLSENLPANAAETDAEGLAILQNYLTINSFLLFPMLLLVRGLAAVIYRSAVLKALRKGLVSREELHPRLAGWLDRLGLMPSPVVTSLGLVQAVKVTGRWGYRRLMYGLLFLNWLFFVAVTIYVSYFFVAHPGLRFLNHTLIQFPCFDYIPEHLWTAVHS